MTNTLAVSDHPLVACIRQLEDLSILTDEMIEGRSADELLEALGHASDAMAILRLVYSLIDAAVIQALGNQRGPVPVPGGGTYKVAGGRPKKIYDNEALIGAIGRKIVDSLDAAAIVTADGEQADPAAVIGEVVRTIAGLAAADTPSFSGWRKGDADKLGITLARYCETTTSGLEGRIESRR